jgi:hypothetical protein
LLAEEEEHQRQMEKKRLEMGKQATKLSAGSSCDGSNLASPLNSGKRDLLATKLPKKCKNKNTYIENTPVFLSPQSQFGASSQAEVVPVGKSLAKIGSDAQGPMWQATEIGQNMPADSAQRGLGVQKQSTNSSRKSPTSQVFIYGAERCLREKVKTGPNCVMLETPKPGVAAETCGKADSRSMVPALTQKTTNSTAGTARQQSCPLISKDISNRKHQESAFETATDACFSANGEMVPKSPSGQQGSEINYTQKLTDLEHLIFEKHKQEKQDRLFALQLQKQLDKEEMRPNRQKGSPDEYQLRSTSSLPQSSTEQRKKAPDKLLKGKRT